MYFLPHASFAVAMGVWEKKSTREPGRKWRESLLWSIPFHKAIKILQIEYIWDSWYMYMYDSYSVFLEASVAGYIYKCAIDMHRNATSDPRIRLHIMIYYWIPIYIYIYLPNRNWLHRMHIEYSSEHSSTKKTYLYIVVFVNITLCVSLYRRHQYSR